MTAVSVVIVAYESGALLERCLAALKAQTFTDLEIILSDNSLEDTTARRLAEADPALVYRQNGENLGFAEGVNRGAALARGDWLALLNPDAFARPDWLEQLMAATARHPDTHAFASLQMAEDDPRLMDGAGDGLSVLGLPFRMGYRRPRPERLAEGEVFAASGAAMLIRRETFLALGGLEAGFFAYCEDVDLGWRLRLAGGRARLVPTAVVDHVGSATTGLRSEFALYHGTRNRLWMLIRNLSPAQLAIVGPLHLFATLALAVRAVIRGEAGPFLRGLVDGLAGVPAQWRCRPRAWPRARAAGRAMTLNPITALSRGLDIRC